jgi:ubiquinol-cytochrome c reductase cytochrome c subunit
VAYATVAAAATPKAQTVAAANAPANEPVDVRKGRQLYETSCITCHGQNLQGVLDRGPSLIGVGSASVYFQVSTGGCRRPSRARRSRRRGEVRRGPDAADRGVRAVGRRRAGDPDRRPARSDANLAEGGELFRLNCASCHNFAGRGGALSAGKYAPSLEAPATRCSGPRCCPARRTCRCSATTS